VRPKSSKPRRGRRFDNKLRLRSVRIEVGKMPPKIRQWFLWFRWCELTNTRVKSNDPRHK